MGDPLSIAASVAGLITLTEYVLVKGFAIGKTIKDAESEISSLLSETSNLFGTLQSLSIISRQFEAERLGGMFF